MKLDDSQAPQPIKDDRKTTDLCGQQHGGARCMKTRGHDGHHECLFWRGEDSLRWE